MKRILLASASIVAFAGAAAAEVQPARQPVWNEPAADTTEGEELDGPVAPELYALVLQQVALEET